MSADEVREMIREYENKEREAKEAKAIREMQAWAITDIAKTLAAMNAAIQSLITVAGLNIFWGVSIYNCYFIFSIVCAMWGYLSIYFINRSLKGFIPKELLDVK